MAQNTGIPSLPPLSGGTPQVKVRAPTRIRRFVDLEGFTQEDLEDLRVELNGMLPSSRLRDVSMERELVQQLAVVHKLQRDVITDDDTPANQKAQVAGQVANVLSVLSKLQVEVYSSERLKKLEATLIETIKTLPMDSQIEFMELYERNLSATNA
jgi:hypothetical protein